MQYRTAGQGSEEQVSRPTRGRGQRRSHEVWGGTASYSGGGAQLATQGGGGGGGVARLATQGGVEGGTASYSGGSGGGNS